MMLIVVEMAKVRMGVAMLCYSVLCYGYGYSGMVMV